MGLNYSETKEMIEKAKEKGLFLMEVSYSLTRSTDASGVEVKKIRGLIIKIF